MSQPLTASDNVSAVEISRFRIKGDTFNCLAEEKCIVASVYVARKHATCLVSVLTPIYVSEFTFAFKVRFYSYIAFPEAFEDIYIGAAPNPRVWTQPRNVRCPREAVDHREGIVIVKISNRSWVWYAI